jgi:hypothetical protein
MEWVPGDRAEVENMALPPLREALPKVEPASKNVTVPVAAEGETVAVKVTLWPETEGLALEATAVAVAARFTVWDKDGDVLPEWPESPP